MRNLISGSGSWSRVVLGGCAVIAMTCLGGNPAAAATVDAKRVVDTDTAVPGGPFEEGTSSSFTTIYSGAVAGGRLVFNGWVQGNYGIILGEGLYSIDVGGGEPQLIADTRTCLQEPCSTATNVFGGFGDTFSFDGTTVAFDARLGSFSGPVGVWSATGPALTLVVMEGDPNPSGGSFDTFDSPAIDGSEVAFTERSSNAEKGIFAAPTIGGDARVVVDDITAAPGGGGALFNPSSMSKVAYRDGLLTFRGILDNGSQGVYAEDDGGLRVVVDSSTPVPGLGGPTFTSISSVMTDGGDIAFVGGTPSVTTGRGIFAEREGSLLSEPIMLAWSIGGSRDPCDQSTRLLFLDSVAMGDGSVAFVSEGALYSARIGTSGLSRLLVTGDTVDGKTVDFIGSGTLHLEAVSDGAVFPRISFTDGSMGIYCLGIPETSQCSPAPVPDRCLTVPEPGASVQIVVAAASVVVLRRRRRKSEGSELGVGVERGR